MKQLIVIIDLHCDATMPSGAQEFGGGNTYARNLMLGLLERDCDFIYITRKKYPFLEASVRLSRSAYLYRLDLGGFGADDKDVLQHYYDQALEQILNILSSYTSRAYRFVFHSCYWQSGRLASILAEQFRTFYIHTVLSNGRSKVAQGAVSDLADGRIETETLVFQKAKFIICSSDSERQDLISLYGLPKQKLVVTGRWVDLRYRVPLYRDDGSIATNSLGGRAPVHYLPAQPASAPRHYMDNSAWWQRKGYLYLGRIHENKGVPEIIVAWLFLYQKFGERTPPLWLAGGSAPQIDEMRRQLGVRFPEIYAAEQTTKLVWWGTLDPAGVSTLLLKAMALVMHSKYEAGGIVVLEAMSQGVPVLATPFGYAKNYVEDWRNGFLIPHGDTRLLARRMEHFIYHPYLSNVLGRQARLDADRIQGNWNFIQTHLHLYGLLGEEDICSFAGAPQAAVDAISSYPYCGLPLEDSYIERLLQHWLGSEDVCVSRVDTDSRAVCRRWTATTQGRQFTLTALDDLPCWSPLWSCGEGTPVLTKYQRTQMILFGGEHGCFPPVVRSDPTQGLLLRQDGSSIRGSEGARLRLMEKIHLMDRLFLINPSPEMENTTWLREQPLTLLTAAAHLERMSAEVQDWAPETSAALQQTCVALQAAAERNCHREPQLGLCVLGLEAVEAEEEESVFTRSPRALLCRSTWGAGQAAFLMAVCKVYPLCLEEVLSQFERGEQNLLRAWISYYQAVCTLADVYGIPESYMR